MIILEAILIISKRQVAYDLACKKILFQMIFACTVCITITSTSILGTQIISNFNLVCNDVQNAIFMH